MPYMQEVGPQHAAYGAALDDLYALYVCLICMPYMYALYVCLICRRWDHSTQHTAQHLMTALASDIWSADTIRFSPLLLGFFFFF